MGMKCIGVDVGGTSVKMGIFETTGELLDKWEVKTRKEENGKYILPDVAASIREKVSAMGLDLKTDIAGAGLGVPGPVMPDGSVEVCVNLGWKNVNPQKELSALLDGIPVKSGNDANVAALGEMWQGGGKGYDNLVMITLGTGVGGGDPGSEDRGRTSRSGRRDRTYPCKGRGKGILQLRRSGMSGADLLRYGHCKRSQKKDGCQRDGFRSPPVR